MPLRPSVPHDPAWDEVVTRWEAAARAAGAPADLPATTPTEDQAYRVLRAMQALATPGTLVAERFTGAFAGRDDVEDALEEVRSAWEELRDHAQEALGRD